MFREEKNARRRQGIAERRHFQQLAARAGTAVRQIFCDVDHRSARCSVYRVVLLTRGGRNLKNAVT
jgi:hypothetical protein